MGIIDQTKIDQLKERQNLSFDAVFALIMLGLPVKRAHWKELRYIQRQRPDENSKMKQAYLYAVPLDNQPVPYTLSNTDLFAEDWQFFKA